MPTGTNQVIYPIAGERPAELRRALQNESADIVAEIPRRPHERGIEDGAKIGGQVQLGHS